MTTDSNATMATDGDTTMITDGDATMMMSDADSLKRDSLNGVWKLDKTRGKWSMRGYLETLHVNELAIQAHEKGELDHDTSHTITLDDKVVNIVKRSRVNNDLVVELTLGEELVQFLQPGQRAKKSLATTEDPGKHLKILSSLLTMNGMAHVTDTKRLVQEENNKSVLVQELTIVNEQTGQSNTTTRYFNATVPPPVEKVIKVEEGGDAMKM